MLKIRRSVLKWESLALIPLALGLAALVCSVIPFSPYDFRHYEITPDAVCPGEPIEVFVVRGLNDEFSIHRVSVDAAWVSRDGQSRLGDTSVTLLEDQVTYGERKILNSAMRVAPVVPGEWYPRNVIHVTGRVGIVPRTQLVDARGSDKLTVLPEDHPNCSDRP